MHSYYITHGGQSHVSWAHLRSVDIFDGHNVLSIDEVEQRSEDPPGLCQFIAARIGEVSRGRQKFSVRSSDLTRINYAIRNV